MRVRVGDDRIYRWEFERGDEQLEIDVPGSLTVDQGHVGLEVARQGAALMYAPDLMVRKLVADGAVTTVLDDWVCHGPGYHLYYSSRRHVPGGLRLLVELIRELRPLGL